VRELCAMTGSGDTATLRMRGAPHAEPKIHGGDRKGETQQPALSVSVLFVHSLSDLISVLQLETPLA